MMTATVNSTAWNKALRNLFGAQTKRNLQDFTNGQALAMASRTFKLTKVVDKERIAADLEKGVSHVDVRIIKHRRGKRAGTTSIKAGRKWYSDNSMIIRLLGKRMRETGSFGVRGADDTDIQAAARKLHGLRKASAGFIRSGWIPAVRMLATKIYRNPSLSTTMMGTKIMGQAKGGAKPATFTWNVPTVAQIWNTALIVSKDGKSSDPVQVASAALDEAFGIQAADMANHLKKVMDAEIRRTANG